jgi:outer membrane protein assembly factor BamB
MFGVMLRSVALFVVVTALCTAGLSAKDWPQWRGPAGDARTDGFKAPKTWPKELNTKWQVTVGDGVSSPALVGDRLYVFTRQKEEEILRCLEAATGKEVWAEKLNAPAFKGPDARGFTGPRSSPAVGGGKVVTIGVHGVLTCRDADTGKQVWQVDAYKGKVPQFHTSSSPFITDGLCIVQLGGGSGPIIAYELASGKEKWKSTETGTSYASPLLLTVGGTKAVVASTSSSIVAVDAADGKTLWKTPFKTRYNASTPVVEGDTVIYGGSKAGPKAVKLEKGDKELKATDLWASASTNSVMYNTPVVRDGFLYGVSEANRIFCLDMKDGKAAWTAPLATKGGYGSTVSAGPVMLALGTGGQLVVFEPNGKEYKELAKYPVGEGTYAYPIADGQRIFIKDQNSVALYLVGE